MEYVPGGVAFKVGGVVGRRWSAAEWWTGPSATRGAEWKGWGHEGRGRHGVEERNVASRSEKICVDQGGCGIELQSGAHVRKTSNMEPAVGKEYEKNLLSFSNDKKVEKVRRPEVPLFSSNNGHQALSRSSIDNVGSDRT